MVKDEREEEGTSSDVVVDEPIRVLLVPKLLQWIGPEDVAHETMRRRLPEPVDLRTLTASARREGSTEEGRTVRRSSRVFNSGLRPP